jgi:hypothetical protein
MYSGQELATLRTSTLLSHVMSSKPLQKPTQPGPPSPPPTPHTIPLLKRKLFFCLTTPQSENADAVEEMAYIQVFITGSTVLDLKTWLMSSLKP